jgi:Na+-transporting NADH:ubiquinone oxidoreductase subunit E
MVIRNYGFFQSLAFGFGSGLGWLLAALLMAGLRRRLRFSTVPRGLEGLGITLIVTGIMAMAFMAFNGMVRIQ